MFFVAALVVAPASAATGDESVIASEVFAFVNDEREARGLAALPDQAPGTGSVQGVYGVVTAPSGAAVVQMMGDDYRRAIILDADALSMQVRATCDGGELTVRVGVHFHSGAGSYVPPASPVVTPADAGTRCGPSATPTPEPAPDRTGPTARPTDDSCPPGHVPAAGFDDIAGNAHQAAIDCVVWWGVAAGKSPRVYDPAGPVSRGQMASFLARLITESGGTLPDAPADRFGDDDGNPHETAINQLAQVGVGGGKPEGLYHPGEPVRRDQMASFLIRAHEYRSGSTLPDGGDWFSDDDGNPHEANINKAAQYGFTGGGPSGGYEPTGRVPRAQMASFLTRVLDLLVKTGFAVTPEEEPAGAPNDHDHARAC